MLTSLLLLVVVYCIFLIVYMYCTIQDIKGVFGCLAQMGIAELAQLA
jgi:hypothetical protein